MAMPFGHGLAQVRPRVGLARRPAAGSAVVGGDETAVAEGGRPANVGPNGTSPPCFPVPFRRCTSQHVSHMLVHGVLR